MPLQDPAEGGTAAPFVPQPEGTPFLLGTRPPGPSLPCTGLFATPHGPAPMAPSAPGSKDWLLLGNDRPGIAGKQKDEAAGSEGTDRSKADGAPGMSRPCRP